MDGIRAHQVVEAGVLCYHCGEPCIDTSIEANDKHFCCTGCKLVYELLNEHNLCTYYSLNPHPGSNQNKNAMRFEYLNIPEVSRQLIRFSDDQISQVTLYIPSMHCSSCIWLLEHLHTLENGIVQSTVNFQQKEVRIVFNHHQLKLSEVASLVASTGYEPQITLSDVDTKTVARKRNYKQIIRIAVAGFAFGNIMMLSFPEYFGMSAFGDNHSLEYYFRYLNLVLSLPVITYSAAPFFVAAWKSIRHRFLNIDAPIALAILVTFLRSVYEIISGTGAGYLDSMTGIVFFMLIGRYVQQATYDNLSFDRDYASFFPVAADLIDVDGVVRPVQVTTLKPGDQIRIRNGELIPADCELIGPATHIDYSFVSGESDPVKKQPGDMLYAGGRQLDGSITLQVTRAVSQSYLTQLWNREGYERKADRNGFVDRVNRYFTWSVLSLAAGAFAYWSVVDSSRAWNALSAILIVACPCGLLLAATFTHGNILRILGKLKCYLKNSDTISALASIDTLVFDKTGTIMHGSQVDYVGLDETLSITQAVSLAAQSSHTLSRKISTRYPYVSKRNVSAYREIPGSGISGTIDGLLVKLGSELFVTGQRSPSLQQASRVFLSVDDDLKGVFTIRSSQRPGLRPTLQTLNPLYDMHLLSGDHDGDRAGLKDLFLPDHMHFNQNPGDKLEYIRSLQYQGKKVMMVGDGLNDAHALRQSDCGMAISDDSNNISPACNLILHGSSFARIPQILRFAKAAKRIIKIAFFFSLIYNLVGLGFAVQGILSPVVAAILMPLSTLSIVLITTGLSRLTAWNIFGMPARSESDNDHVPA